MRSTTSKHCRSPARSSATSRRPACSAPRSSTGFAAAVLRRSAGNAGGHRLLPAGTGSGGDGAAARSATRRDCPDQPRPPVVADRVAGGTLRRGRRRAAARRVRLPPRSRAERGARRSRERATSPGSTQRATSSPGSGSGSRSQGRWRTPTSRRSPTRSEAFEAFTRSYPNGSTLLIDTYDTVEGARRAAKVALSSPHEAGGSERSGSTRATCSS